MKVWVLNPPYLQKYSRAQRSPAVTKSGTLYFPIWLAYSAGVLEEAKHEATFTDAPARGISREDILHQAGTLQPDMIVMDTSTPSIENDLEVATLLRNILPKAFIVMVGTHVSALPEETLLKGEAVNAVARREYDYTIRDLAELLSRQTEWTSTEEALNTVPGLSYRSGNRVVHNEDRPFIENLDELPWVSRVYKKYLPIKDYFNQNALYPMVTLVTSRGCPFRCTFCVYPQTFTGRRYRFRSIEDVIGEMQYVIESFPKAKSIFFEDDTLTANKRRCIAFADAILEKGLTIPWTANSRSDLDLETMNKIRAAGCRELCVGFESGDEQVLDRMKKGVGLKQMFRFMEDARKTGLLIHGCFMVGFPGESAESVHKTIDLAVRLNPDTVQFYPVMVYPGTEAYEEYKALGWITAKNYAEWLTPEGLHNCMVRNEALTSAELVRLCDEGRKKFYLRPRYIGYKLFQMVAKPSEIRRTAKAARVFAKHLFLGSKV